MLATRRQTWLSPQDYLALENDGAVRHEYVDGEVFAMVGASKRHGRIVVALFRALDSAVRQRGLEIFVADLKVRVAAANAYYYPDLVVATAADAGGTHVIEQPVVVIEVLSPTTEAVDRREKRRNYQTIPSLQELVLVAQEERMIELYRRHDDGWVVETIRDDGAVQLRSIGAEFSIDQIYL